MIHIRRSSLLAAALLLAAGAAMAQKPATKSPPKPDFSGAWNFDAQATGGRITGAQASPLVIKQTRTVMIVERKAADGSPMTHGYPLDGTPSTNQYKMSSGIITELKSVAKWDGDVLVISTSRGAGEPVVERWAVKNDVLTIESGPSKRVYRRAK